LSASSIVDGPEKRVLREIGERLDARAIALRPRAVAAAAQEAALTARERDAGQDAHLDPHHRSMSLTHEDLHSCEARLSAV
jgi:hypothetical protein